MRLKYLELHGYKTFASRTEFAFEGGVTAIVGPNGSGKSNVADAIRWVLGEQSYRSLRGKRTADMIFSGSAQRARLGMASATLDLDNSDGWLPIDFSDVTITRRAYRSGENEYLLNGKRVRLREISELLSSSGLAQRTYTVIGQGLVDAVLSLRPEDRRALFEEAAGIALYRSKRSNALTRMAETKSNLLRANDIINEIAPRLRRLERSAERAERQLMLSQQLEELLRTWYGYRWRQTQLNLQRARDACARREARLQRRRDALEALDSRGMAVRVQQGQVREKLRAWHKESSELHRQMEDVQRELAVWQERGSQLDRRRDEWQIEVGDRETRAQATHDRLQAAETDVAECLADKLRKETTASAAQAELDSYESLRTELAGKLAEGQKSATDLGTRVMEVRTHLAQMGGREESLVREKAVHQQNIGEQQTALAGLRAEIQTLSVRLSDLERAGEQWSTELSRFESRLEESRVRQTDLHRRKDDAQRSVERLRGRHELLSRVRQDGEELHAGVRTVLQSAARDAHRDLRRGREPMPGAQPSAVEHEQGHRALTGILGTVGELLQVPEEYEAAFEAVLGAELQYIVTETWTDAEAAIALLRQERAGRATFLPLDTVRPAPRLDLGSESGVIETAADLVTAEERLAAVVEMLLGRTIVVSDLEAARPVYRRLQGGFQIVTLAGEVLGSRGSLSGGLGDNKAGRNVLAREREWRELPDQIRAARQKRQEIETELESALTDEGELRQRIERLEAQRRDHEASLTELNERRRDLDRQAGHTVDQIAWREGLIQELDVKREELQAEAILLHSDLDRLTSEEAEVKYRVTSVQVELGCMGGEDLYGRLSIVRAEEAVARRTWEHRRATLATLRERYEDLSAQLEGRRERLALLEDERSTLALQTEGHISQEAAVRGWLAALSQKIEPAEAELRVLETEREEQARVEASLRTRLHEAQSQYSQAVLSQGQQEDRLARLRDQIVDDFGLVEMAPTEGLPEQPLLPLAGMVSSVPAVETLPEGLEGEIRQIRAQMKRMGSINPNAPQEYAEELERYTFLTEQAADLQETTHRLRQVISELDDVMRDEFRATFETVEAQFKQNFTRLFGGGSARLILTEPDDMSQTGVEIEAQPPGKRQQTLALLSGGERSLTAVSLIFALLDASPPPFCILDEVDAMLDDANVRRFRQMLAGLSERTQFIVITHNRTTIEAADTIYGVSMGEDSVSQVVSLRLGGENLQGEKAPENQGG